MKRKLSLVFLILAAVLSVFAVLATVCLHYSQSPQEQLQENILAQNRIDGVKDREKKSAILVEIAEDVRFFTALDWNFPFFHFYRRPAVSDEFIVSTANELAAMLRSEVSAKLADVKAKQAVCDFIKYTEIRERHVAVSPQGYEIVDGNPLGNEFLKTVTRQLTQRLRDEATKYIDSLAPDKTVGGLEELLADRAPHAVPDSSKDNPAGWKIADGPFTPPNHIGSIVERQMFKNAGGGKPSPDSIKILGGLIAFSVKLEPMLTGHAVRSLKERRLDSLFLAGDYGGAVKLLESGDFTYRGENWTGSMIAKIRAVKAMHEKNYPEALANYRKFAELLASQTSEAPDYDPETGVAYSAWWLMAQTYERCAGICNLIKDEKQGRAMVRLAQENYKKALEAAKGDEKTLSVLKPAAARLGL